MSDEPHWVQQPVLKIPLTAGKSALTEMIERGRVLEREVAGVEKPEDCVLRVREWQRTCGQWLDTNLGGQAADEFMVSVTEVTTYAWMSAVWREYGGIRRRDIRSELQVLTSILQRLPGWAKCENSEPERSATIHKLAPLLRLQSGLIRCSSPERPVER